MTKSIFLCVLLFISGTSLAQTSLPDCLDGYADSSANHREENVRIQSEGAELDGKLFLPASTGPHPAVIILPGGGSNAEVLRLAPRFLAPRLAQCGIAALVYDKRGVGNSSGDYATSTFDDFVVDGEHCLEFLTRHLAIDAKRIGVLGFSQGGRLAPVIAVRSHGVAFVVSLSAPFTSVEDTRLFAIEQRPLLQRIPDSILKQSMHLWQKHLGAVASGDTLALNQLDEELDRISKDQNHRLLPLLPPRSNQIPRDAIAIYNSMGRDYTTELGRLQVPWLCLYGEKDTIVPVKESISIIHQQMARSEKQNYDITVFPSADHNFTHTKTGKRIYFETTVIDWITSQL